MERGVQEGIVSVHMVETVEDSRNSFMLMDFYEGGDLSSELKRHRGRRLEEVQAATVVRSIAHTLSLCHRMGVIHMDVKPQNILLRRPATTEKWPCEIDFVLADFGLARRLRRGGHVITDGYVAGTKEYMAPEMIMGEAYDEKVDVWSLGMLLHVLLTGGFPAYIGQAHRIGGRSGLLRRMARLCPDELDVSAAPSCYAQLSDAAISLLRGMLQKKPGLRLTMSQVMAHPWLKKKQLDHHHLQQQHKHEQMLLPPPITTVSPPFALPDMFDISKPFAVVAAAAPHTHIMSNNKSIHVNNKDFVVASPQGGKMKRLIRGFFMCAGARTTKSIQIAPPSEQHPSSCCSSSPPSDSLFSVGVAATS